MSLASALWALLVRQHLRLVSCGKLFPTAGLKVIEEASGLKHQVYPRGVCQACIPTDKILSCCQLDKTCREGPY